MLGFPYFSREGVKELISEESFGRILTVRGWLHRPPFILLCELIIFLMVVHAMGVHRDRLAQVTALLGGPTKGK